jgi:hypothetical protein
MPDVTIDAVMNNARMAVQGSDIATPASGFVQVYQKSGGMYVRNSAGTVSGPFVLPDTSFAGDLMPANILHGLANRFIHKVYTPDNHFAVASIPSGYSWVSTTGFEGTPGGYVAYNHVSDYMVGACTDVTKRTFLSRAVTTGSPAGNNWKGKSLVGRFSSGVPTEIGLRLDDGSDNNYAEIYTTGVLADGNQRLDFRYRAGGGSVTVVPSAVIVPVSDFLVLQLYLQYVASTYVLHGFLVGEDGAGNSITSFSINAPAWVGGTGRAGITIKSYGTVAKCDWFLNQFV